MCHVKSSKMPYHMQITINPRVPETSLAACLLCQIIPREDACRPTYSLHLGSPLLTRSAHGTLPDPARNLLPPSGSPSSFPLCGTFNAPFPCSPVVLCLYHSYGLSGGIHLLGLDIFKSISLLNCEHSEAIFIIGALIDFNSQKGDKASLLLGGKWWVAAL